MGFAFTGVINGVMTLKQTLLTGGASGIGSILLGDLGDIVFKGVKISLKEIVIDVVVAGVTGVVFAGIAYGLSKAFAALKLNIFSKGGSRAKYYNPDGSPIWPPNRGFEGNPTTTILEPIFVYRYGYDGGTFVSPKGTPYTERALPTGGGTQYEFNQKISDLLEQGILRKVGN